MNTIKQTIIDSPLGPLLVRGSDQAVQAVLYGPHPPGAPRDCPEQLRAVAEQLAAYFAGELAEFDLPLAPVGTPFQRAVWAALDEIPYGQTVGYGVIARRIGRPSAARAVGAACGRNPISVITPCHRVVGSSGALTGYAGGMENKRFLLELEARAAVPAGRASVRGRPAQLRRGGEERQPAQLTEAAPHELEYARERLGVGT